jgi:uncharacterized protein YdhG (YjbR/CyaY superfamily)
LNGIKPLIRDKAERERGTFHQTRRVSAHARRAAARIWRMETQIQIEDPDRTWDLRRTRERPIVSCRPTPHPDMPKKSKHDPDAVDAYLSTLPRAERDALERLRALIKETVPGVEERVSYGTTVMFARGRDLVGFVSQPKHLSFFTASPELALAMKDEISKTHKVSGATIHFSPDSPLPAGLVKKILSARVRENAALGRRSSRATTRRRQS